MREKHNRDGIFADLCAQIKINELRQYLTKLHKPVWECELLRVAFPDADLIWGAAIDIFRWHFVLFHTLYSLQPEFADRGSYLHIHFMGICVKPVPAQSRCQYFDAGQLQFCGAPCGEEAQWCDFHFPEIEDSALTALSERYFYLDQANFSAISAENAEKFINGAWQLLQNYEEYEQSLVIMGLPDGVTIDLLKKRFRYLAKTMHPDISAGHHEEFAKINTAYRLLLAYLSAAQKS